MPQRRWPRRGTVVARRVEAVADFEGEDPSNSMSTDRSDHLQGVDALLIDLFGRQPSRKMFERDRWQISSGQAQNGVPISLFIE